MTAPAARRPRTPGGGAVVKAPKISVGYGTLGRFKRGRPLVVLSLQDNGYGEGSLFGGDSVTNWTCMTAAEAKRLGARLLSAGIRAQRTAPRGR